ncbi:MAG: hypothetical protein NUV82_00550 [Candidatus Komeilibacteria bacterium]|nr:hypothetical protein [Candidatus Komeilibacteria bacterium]
MNSNGTISGSLMECYRHFFNTYLTSATHQNIIEDFVSFIGLKRDTLQNWISALPKGENLIRLKFYLIFQGYRITDSIPVSKVIKDACEILAIRIVKTEDFRDAIGYARTDDFLRVLGGRSGYSEEKKARLKYLYESHLPQIQAAKDRLLRVNGTLVGPLSQKNDSSLAPLLLLKESLRGVESGLKITLNFLAGMSSEINSSAEARKLIREELGNDLLFETSNLTHSLYSKLNILISEKSREIQNLKEVNHA